MKKWKELATISLFEKNYISEEQFVQIKAYRGLNIFSLHNELRFLLYLSVTLFTSGIGILIYQNIDSIGHIAMLSVLFLIIIVSFYFCFKNASKFEKQETFFQNSLYDYLLLLANILTCTFVGYLQFQYQTFGTHYGLATIIPTIISFASAYYFDNKSCLSIGISGLAAYIGLSVSPQTLLEGSTFDTDNLSYSGVILGFLLVFWTIYNDKIGLKKHFKLVFLTFALHLISISCINNLFNDYWYIFMLIIGVSSYYFFKTSHQIQAISLYVFAILYGYFSFNISMSRILDALDWDNIPFGLFYLSPIYFIFSVVYFIKLIKDFKKETHDSI
jgi:Predicted membrane protein (DUF2157)